jgi:hypothetical protein
MPVFPSESPAAEAAPTPDSHAKSPEPGFHDVASRQQSAPLSRPAPLPAAARDPPEVKRWYGGYTLMTDGISLAAAIAGGLADPDGDPFLLVATGRTSVGSGAS